MITARNKISPIDIARGLLDDSLIILQQVPVTQEAAGIIVAILAMIDQVKTNNETAEGFGKSLVEMAKKLAGLEWIKEEHEKQKNGNSDPPAELLIHAITKFKDTLEEAKICVTDFIQKKWWIQKCLSRTSDANQLQDIQTRLSKIILEDIVPALSVSIKNDTAVIKNDTAVTREEVREVKKMLEHFTPPSSPSHQQEQQQLLLPHDADTTRPPVPREELYRELVDAIVADKTQVSITSSASHHKVKAWGLGGVGKTTLARMVIAEWKENKEGNRIRERFPDGVAWVTLGNDESNILERVRDVWQQLFSERPDQGLYKDLASLKQGLRGKLASKRCLVVLDDVWKKEHADAFDFAGTPSVLLVTSRFSDVVSGATEVKVGFLQDHKGEMAQSMLRHSSGVKDDEPLPPAALMILTKFCRGHPLAITIAGSIKHEDTCRTWEEVLARLEEAEREGEAGMEFTDGEAQEAAQYDQYKDLWTCIKVSLSTVTPEVKECLSWYAVLAEDTWVSKALVQKLWGLSSVSKTEKMLKELASRSLIELKIDEGWKSSVLDLVRDFVRREVIGFKLHGGEKEEDDLGLAKWRRMHGQIFERIGGKGAVEAVYLGIGEINKNTRQRYGIKDIPSPLSVEVSQYLSSNYMMHLQEAGGDEDAVKSFGRGLGDTLKIWRVENSVRMEVDSDGEPCWPWVWEMLFQAGCSMTGLQTLDLLRNRIGDEGAKALAVGLQHVTGLQTLDLSGNSIGDEGAKALGEGLQHVTGLQTLVLACNSIGAEGAKALGEGLQHVTGLRL